MIFRNSTSFDISQAIIDSVSEFPTDDLEIEIRYCPRGSKRYVSGTYYRRMKNRPDGRLIRLRINRNNPYPLDVHFKTSEYTRERDRWGRENVYQKLQTVRFERPEDLLLGVFFHEFSHYLDHVEGLNGNYKQTKADKFALAKLERIGLI